MYIKNIFTFRNFGWAQPNRRVKSVKTSSFLLIFFSFLALLTACDTSPNSELWTIQGQVMGTYYNVKLAPNSTAKLEALNSKVQATLNNIDQLMSTYRSDSEITKINQALVGHCTPVSPKTQSVIRQAQTISQASNGSFDITVGPLVDIWGFGPKKSNDTLPSTEEVKRAFDQVGYQAIRILEISGKPCVIKDKPREIDLSSIAKGFAVDVLVETLVKEGFTSFLIELGGEIWAQGLKPDGSPWRIAIEMPDTQMQMASHVIEVDRMGVATSGDYRNFFTYNGKKYSHTIDTKTGFPVQNGIASVTIILPSVALADAWATALLASPLKQAKELVEKNKFQAVFIGRSETGELEFYRSTEFCLHRGCVEEVSPK